MASGDRGTSIVALDLATVTGYARIDPDGVVTSGHMMLAGGVGQKCDKLMQFLDSELTGDLIIVFERPGFFRSMAAARVAHGLAATVELWCYLNKSPYYERSPSAVKKHATGSGNAPKPKMIQAARRLFPEQRITDDNQADALCLLHCFANS